MLTLLTGRTIDEPGSGADGDKDTPDRYVDPSATVKVPSFRAGRTRELPRIPSLALLFVQPHLDQLLPRLG